MFFYRSFDRLFVALALALECGRFNVGRAPSSTIYDLSKHIFDQQ